jgi:SAM-dependent methyltransferase
MTNILNSIIRQTTNIYKKSSNWGKILIFIMLLIIVMMVFKTPKTIEGFEQNEQFLLKSGTDMYDGFYVDVYDYLVFNNLKDEYEVGEIINKTNPTSESRVLDIGCGTGHHVGTLTTNGFNTVGIDISPAMITKAKENYPTCKFIQGNALDADQFTSNSFTHILCLYFTIYYFKNKRQFFENCMKWLMPGGYLVIHLVDREKFDPILPPGNPLMIVSPQRYAKQRITNTKVRFNDFAYSADFQLDTSNNQAKFIEKFKNNHDGKVRKHEHMFYMEDINEIVDDAQSVGFLLHAQIDLLHCQYEYQYLYVFIKPN